MVVMYTVANAMPECRKRGIKPAFPIPPLARRVKYMVVRCLGQLFALFALDAAVQKEYGSSSQGNAEIGQHIPAFLYLNIRKISEDAFQQIEDEEQEQACEERVVPKKFEAPLFEHMVHPGKKQGDAKAHQCPRYMCTHATLLFKCLHGLPLGRLCQPAHIIMKRRVMP